MRTKESVAGAFDRKAGRYSAGREGEYGFRVQRAAVLRLLRGAGGHALEVGCGSGGITAELRARGFAPVGVDLSPAMARAAADRIPAATAQFLVADIERLCFPDGAFDAVIGMGCLEYLADPAAALAELRRVVRRGGEVVLTVPTPVSPSALADRSFDALPPSVRRLLLRRATLPSGDPVHRLAPWTLDRALLAAGFVPENRAFAHFTMFPFERIARRASEALASVLEPLGRNRVTGLLAKQYIVRATAP